MTVVNDSAIKRVADSIFNGEGDSAFFTLAGKRYMRFDAIHIAVTGTVTFRWLGKDIYNQASEAKLSADLLINGIVGEMEVQLR